MKTLLLIATLVVMPALTIAQPAKGRVVFERITSPALKNNIGGEDPRRRISVYLPPGYDKTTNKYPVIYFLHAFTLDDSLHFLWNGFDLLLDKAISDGKIRPVIVVVADNNTIYRGCVFTNSSLTGNWIDYNVKDVVDHIDKTFRTIAQKDSRGLSGHSQGAYGAIKIGMMFPDVFSCVYALSPSIIGLTKELGVEGIGFKRLQHFKTREELISGYDDIFPNAMVAIGRAFSPNPNNPPFYADLPYVYRGDSLEIRYDVLELWRRNTPIAMVDQYIDHLKKLKALKFDWGRNDEIEHIPPTCLEFSKKLENLGINHFAEEYFGKHTDRVWTPDGRAMNQMLPFFNDYLAFEEITYGKKQAKR